MQAEGWNIKQLQQKHLQAAICPGSTSRNLQATIKGNILLIYRCQSTNE